ncbi:hypothetical protein WICPIJ_008938, partial [Wickerhamomyces pijperi]
ACTKVPVTTGVTVVTATSEGVETVHTTYCPLTASTSTAEVQHSTVVTITSCSDGACTKVPVTTGVTVVTATSEGVETVYTTYCPLTASTSTAEVQHSTVVTVTSCSDGGCTRVPVTTAVSVGPTTDSNGALAPGSKIVPEAFTSTFTDAEGSVVTGVLSLYTTTNPADQQVTRTATIIVSTPGASTATSTESSVAQQTGVVSSTLTTGTAGTAAGTGTGTGSSANAAKTESADDTVKTSVVSYTSTFVITSNEVLVTGTTIGVHTSIISGSTVEGSTLQSSVTGSATLIPIESGAASEGGAGNLSAPSWIFGGLSVLLFALI